MVIPQIDTELALHNLDMACTGVEAVFCGPYDLTMSLRIFRQFDNPELVKALELIVSTCRAHNVAPGVLAPIGPIERSLRLGFKLVSDAKSGKIEKITS
jgi:2-keto-3-deoxy-L-rhamnonate aldolase RhmA